MVLASGDEDWVHQRVISFLAERSQRDPNTISREDKLQGLELDSLDYVELIMGLEDEFKVDVPDGGATITTVGDLIDTIRRAL